MDDRNILDTPDENNFNEGPYQPYPLWLVLPLSAILMGALLFIFNLILNNNRVLLKSFDFLLILRVLSIFGPSFISIFLLLKFSDYKNWSTRKVNFIAWLMLFVAYSVFILLEFQSNHFFQPFSMALIIFEVFPIIGIAIFITGLQTMGIYAYLKFKSTKILMGLSVIYLLVLFGVFFFFGA